jgi:prefoldin subunit 5
MPMNFNDPMGEIVANLQAKIGDLEKELSDTKANLQRAYNGIDHYKTKWQQVLELNAELQKQLDENKEG